MPYKPLNYCHGSEVIKRLITYMYKSKKKKKKSIYKNAICISWLVYVNVKCSFRMHPCMYAALLVVVSSIYIISSRDDGGGDDQEPFSTCEISVLAPF